MGEAWRQRRSALTHQMTGKMKLSLRRPASTAMSVDSWPVVKRDRSDGRSCSTFVKTARQTMAEGEKGS